MSVSVSLSDRHCPTTPCGVVIPAVAPRQLAFAATSTQGASSVFACTLNDVDIVNEAGGPEHGGTQHDQQVGVVVAFRVRNAQREAVSDRDVVDLPAMARKTQESVR
jgi:hypothetical protein